MGISRLLFASFSLGSLLFTLSGCGGEPIVFNGNIAQSSSTAATLSSVNAQSSTVSTSTNSSDSQSAAANSSAAISSSSAASSADPTGRDLYTSTTLGCSTCHGAAGVGGTSGTDIVPADWSATVLANKIRTSMPPQNDPSNPQYTGVFCNASCASKIAAYIIAGFPASSSTAQPTQFLKSAADNTTPAKSLLSSNASCGLAYSNNDLRPLTKQEYAAAVFQLTGISLSDLSWQNTYNAIPDYKPQAGVDNTLDSDSRLSYSLAASRIIDHLVNTNISEIVDCANLNSNQCYSQLVNNFACKAFRRPLTAAELDNYFATYSASSDRSEGVKKVAKAILASGSFLYRSEIALALIERGTNSQTDLALASANSLISSAKSLALSASSQLNADFSGSDILEISLKSTPSSSGLWPVIRIQVGEATFVDIATNQPTATYKINVTGVTGSHSITIANQPVDVPLGHQTDHNLLISSVKLAFSH